MKLRQIVCLSQSSAVLKPLLVKIDYFVGKQYAIYYALCYKVIWIPKTKGTFPVNSTLLITEGNSRKLLMTLSDNNHFIFNTLSAHFYFHSFYCLNNYTNIKNSNNTQPFLRDRQLSFSLKFFNARIVDNFVVVAAMLHLQLNYVQYLLKP